MSVHHNRPSESKTSAVVSHILGIRYFVIFVLITLNDFLPNYLLTVLHDVVFKYSAQTFQNPQVWAEVSRLSIFLHP